MQVSAILLAAGKSRRLKAKVPKALIRIAREPAIAYSLRTLQDNRHIQEIIVVTNPLNREAIKKVASAFDKSKKVVLGGKERQDSVACGLKEVALSCEFVLIHDAARPFVAGKLLDKIIQVAKNEGAAILAVRVKATVKRAAVEGSGKRGKLKVAETLERNNLWEVQTPQIFRKALIVEAYRRFGKQPATDDAMMVEKMGKPVAVVEGSYDNIKITTQEDLAVANIIAARFRI